MLSVSIFQPLPATSVAHSMIAMPDEVSMSSFSWRNVSTSTQVAERLTVLIAASHNLSTQERAPRPAVRGGRSHRALTTDPRPAIRALIHGALNPAFFTGDALYHIEAFELSHVAVSQAQGSVDVGQDLSQPTQWPLWVSVDSEGSQDFEQRNQCLTHHHQWDSVGKPGTSAET